MCPSNFYYKKQIEIIVSKSKIVYLQTSAFKFVNKIELIRSVLEESSEGEIDETVMQLWIIRLEKANISSEDREHKEEASSISGLKKLALKSIKFNKDKIDLYPQVNFCIT